MKRFARRALSVIAVLVMAVGFATVAFAEGGVAANESNVLMTKAIACAITIAIGSAAGALSMALINTKASDAMARQPEVAGDVKSSSMLGMVFVETAIIYALLTVIFIVFVL